MGDQRDTVLIRKCLEGDVEKYGELVDEYSARIINLAYLMIGNRHDAEDLAQEAFIRAFRALRKFKGQAKFSSWLYQIALNVCKDYLKAKSRQARSIEEEHLATLDAGPQVDVRREILMDELSERMRECVQKLPYVYREAFVLRHLQEVEYEEIAKLTGVPADTVRVRAYRAREMLRELLSPDVDTFWREKAEREK